MEQIKINFHSFIDVITNSSTEIYIQITDKTIDFIKNIINSSLKIAKSELTADDLFEFSISDPSNENNYDMMDSYLIVETKEGLSEDIAELGKYISKEIRNIFHIDAMYEG